jgi:glycosyltransferase involved in cell wall biosynthesis
MIAAIVTAHNEQEYIGECLHLLRRAAHCPRLGGEEVLLVVVLDACSDATESIARTLAPRRCA